MFLQQMLATVSQATDASIKNVLTKLMSLYGLWSLEKHIPTMVIGEFIKGPRAPELIQNAILSLCAQLKDDAVALIDAIAPPDFILNSALGASDGQVMNNRLSSYG